MASPVQERADLLLRELGYSSWRPGQREAIAATFEGRDSLIVMPTGGGKSLCFQLPGLASPDLTIVVSPLIALMRDQCERLVAKGHPVAMVSSGMGPEEVRAALVRISTDARIAYCAPERFSSEEFLKAIAFRRIDMLAIDEAHCISEWGHDFRPDYLRLGALAERLGRPRLQALTATASPPVRKEIAERLGMKDPTVIVRGFDRPNLHLAVRRFSREHGKRQALAEAVRKAKKPGIVYVATRKTSEEIAAVLQRAGIGAEAYHAGLPSKARSDLQDRFMADGIEAMVATTAFGMGIDKPNVRFVFHAGFSSSLDTYYQKVGRAGRDGQPAEACVFYCPEDQEIHRFLRIAGVSTKGLRKVGEAVAERGIADPAELIESVGLPRSKTLEALNRLQETGWLEVSEERGVVHRPNGPSLADAVRQGALINERRIGYDRTRLQMMRSYAEHSGCRRDFILSYFGEEHEVPCGNCDNCDAGTVKPHSRADRPFEIGATVTHRQWGNGEVQRYDGGRVVALFESVGYRTLDLRLVAEKGLLQRAGADDPPRLEPPKPQDPPRQVAPQRLELPRRPMVPIRSAAPPPQVVPPRPEPPRSEHVALQGALATVEEPAESLEELIFGSD